MPGKPAACRIGVEPEALEDLACELLPKSAYYVAVFVQMDVFK